jgi:hypothetical protein
LRSKNRVIVFVLIGIAVLFLLGFFIYINRNNSRHDWSESYKTESLEPYGTGLIANLLEDYFGKDKLETGKGKSLTKALAHQDTTGIRNFVFIGAVMPLSESEADTLQRFVSRGNTAFIICKGIPGELRNTLGFTKDPEEAYELEEATAPQAEMNFYHNDLGNARPYHFKYMYRGDSENYEWYYFNLSHFSDSIQSYARLGYMLPDHPNFIRLSWGKGYFYFHVNPLAFTNYQLMNEQGLEYAEKVFSHLPRERTFLDINRRSPEYVPSSGSHEKGPLSFILSQVSLRWAWYTLLALVVLYFVFRAKRRQRIIPVILPHENTSLEFVQTVGALYYQQHDHQKLSLQKMRLFLLYIRNKYFLPTNVLDDQLMKKLSVKSQVPVEDVQKIFTLYAGFQNTVVDVDQDELIAFHKALDKFYRTCK